MWTRLFGNGIFRFLFPLNYWTMAIILLPLGSLDFLVFTAFTQDPGNIMWIELIGIELEVEARERDGRNSAKCDALAKTTHPGVLIFAISRTTIFHGQRDHDATRRFAQTWWESTILLIQNFGRIINCKEKRESKKQERKRTRCTINTSFLFSFFFFFLLLSLLYYYFSVFIFVGNSWLRESISSSFDEEKNFCRLRKIGAVILICLLLLFLLHQRL